MEKYKISLYCSALLCSILITGCASKNEIVILNSDIHPTPLPAVSLAEYKSVQDRDTTFQNPKLSLGVAISGGGSRAQYFGLGVLIGLEEIKSSDPNSVLNNMDTLHDQALQTLRQNIRKHVGEGETAKQSDNRWLGLYTKLDSSLKTHCNLDIKGYHVVDNDINDPNLRTVDLIKSTEFNKFTPLDVFLLYELASQIETKIDISRIEKAVLILVGRYVAYADRQPLVYLYTYK